MSDATPTVRPHASKHDAIGDLPLVTESARVTAVDRMDRDRRSEVADAIGRICERSDLVDASGVEGPDDWPAVGETFAEGGRPDLARRVGALAQRHGRPDPMLVRARIRPEERVDYLAGQYVGLRYDGTSRAYSLASSPNREEMEICIRRVPGGRLSPRLCRDMAPGDEVTVRGPYGDLVLGDPSERDLVFLATGTGVAPFRGMIDYLFEEGLDEYGGEKRDVWLFLGAAWRDDLPYRRRFRKLADRRENFHFVPCLSRETYLTDWDGETDYVQHALMKHVDERVTTTPMGRRLERWLDRTPDSGVEARIDPANAEVYACGINAMVYSLVRAAERLGVPPEHTEFEGFG